MMTLSSGRLQDRIASYMAEGLIVIDFKGTIMYANPSALSILELTKSDMIGEKFASLFFETPENDEFAQAVLDAAYGQQPSEAVVSYHVKGKPKYLRVVTSLLSDDEEKREGICIVFGDISELSELRDSVKVLDQIRELNLQLENRNKILSTTFGMFLSDEIVSQLLDTPDGLVLGGKKRTLSIMMSDVRGFTAISEKMDPEDLIAMLNHYLATMTDVIQKYDGTIIEFIGDGIMAIFGAPIQYDNHAANAVAAALEMEAAMEKVNQWNTERDYPRLEMGIGLHTGDVIVGNIGSEKRMKYGIVGKNVNLCGRIESYTVGGQILVSPSVIENVSSELRIARELTVSPKGVENEITLSHVTGIGEPYNIMITVDHDEVRELTHPVPVCFYLIHEKHTIKKPCYGGIVSLGRGNAVLETETELQLFDNIRMEAGGRLLCKVIEKTDQRYLLQYTSVPSGYRKWADTV